ncbi:VOC family protein [Cellulomonas citrea]|uniref:VOC family protein n=1 Tax=Cellulomonas citrea TaxID=1909423 RepID=UPI00135C45AB|nr:VOC family protein [Cellulomonas citrea]
MPTVRVHLWLDDRALEAARFWERTVPGSRVVSVTSAPAGTPGVAEGTVFVVEAEVAGVPVTLLNGGPTFALDEAFSFLLEVETQEEIDHFWAALSADGGQAGQCGWLKDRFGVSWQVVPTGMAEVMSGDPAGVGRAMAAMLQMTKLDIAALRAAAAG